MDFRTVVTISALLLMTAEADQTSNETETANETVRDSTNCTCPSASQAITAAPTSKPAPVLHFLTVKWKGKCEGRLVLHTPSSTIPFCPKNITSIQSLLPNVCEDKAGCKGSTNWKRSPDMEDGYHEEKASKTSCGTVRVQCKVEPAKVIPDVQGELQAYKVVTALLCCMLLVLLLIRFTRPTVKALQKRLSDRRQNRWIGPTQSHSVSYHRGKTAVKQNDGEKRLSYPALERLAVSDSREPSSSRNSYNF